jgi:ketosteroid isomerase-like protein
MMKIPPEDRLDIQQLLAQYAFHCDTKDYEQVAELFTDDGIWDETVIGMPRCEGREAIHQFFCGMADSSLEYLIHLNGNHRLTRYDGLSAVGTTHLHVKGHFNGNAIEILGYYADQYEKHADAWLLKSRQLVEIAPSTGFTPMG